MTASDSTAFPVVARDRLERDGWELIGESVETSFELPGHDVRAATRRFRDATTAEAAREIGGVDVQWRFFAATTLSLEPPLPSAASPTFLLPTVRAKATETFRTDLSAQGLTDVRRSRSEQITLDSGESVPLTRFRAIRDLSIPNVAVPFVAWIGVWYEDGFRVGVGTYPDRPIGDALGLDRPPAVLARKPSEYRAELFELIAAVR